MDTVAVQSLQDAGRTVVMGIINATPDSFYDGGRYLEPEAAARHAKFLAASGAHLIDVGAESTRPGAAPVTETEELCRIVPAIEAALDSDLPVSVDTRRGAVARCALDMGVAMINDVTGLRDDPDMARICADYGCFCVIMHMKGTPRTMQENPVYNDIVSDISDFFSNRIDAALDAGIREDRIWLDPGFCFGKTVDQNLELLRRLDEFGALGFPLMIGVSNKSTLGVLLDAPPEDRTEGTAATVALAIAKGVHCVRVHDVKAMARVACVCDAVLRGRRVPDA